MKKKVLRERRNALKIEEVNEVLEKAKELTKVALMQKAKEMGLKVNNKMTKADLEQLIKEA